MKKRDRINLKIYLTNRWLYTLIALLIITIISIGIYAFGGDNPSYVGHSAGELEEADPLFSASSVADGVNWNEISDIPADFADGTDDVLSKGNRVYIVQNTHCANTGALTISSTCRTTKTCEGSFGRIEFWQCEQSGLFGNDCQSTTDICNNNPVGYLVD